MCKRDGAAAALALLVVLTAAAQPAPPEPAASEAAAAMERARRQAAGPMRFILEASKTQPQGQTRRRGGEGDAAAPAVTPLVPSSPRPTAAAEATPAAVPTSPGVTTQITLSAGALQGGAPAAQAVALEATGTAPTPLALPSPLAELPAVQAGPVRPRLASRVDPAVSQRVLDDLGPNAVVLVELTIRTDGGVAAVTPLGSMPRPLQRALVEALGQWRFDPLPQERVHRIELVFNAGN